MAKMFVHYSGSKAEFIAAGLATTYNNSIVFIKGGSDGTGECIYTHGEYFGNFTELISALAYVKGVNVGGTNYNAAQGGGYVKFEAADPATVAINAGSDGIAIGLTEAFTKSVNDVIAEVATIKGDYLTSEDYEALEALITGDSGLEARVAAIEADYLKNADKEALAADIKKNTDAIAVLNGTEAGSVAKAVADAKADLEEQIGNVADAAKSYEIVKVTEGLETNVKEAYKLVDEDGVQSGALIPIYKDSALQSVVLEDQQLKFTYLLTDGTTSVVPVDVSTFLAESEFKDGLQVVDGVVSVKKDVASEAFLSVSADGVKISGVQDAINTKVQELADGAVKTNTEAIATLNGTGEGSVDKKIADAIADLASDGELATLTETVNGLKDQVGTGTVDSRVAAAEAAAKAYADGLAGNYATAGQGAKADTAVQDGVSGTYVTLTKEGTNLKVAETIQAVAGASDTAKGLAEASDVKAYVDAQVSAKNVTAAGDAYVSATAAGNKVTVAATDATKASLALADTALQAADITTGGANGTIAVEGTDVAVKGLQDAAYATVESINTTAKGYADAAETAAKKYADDNFVKAEGYVEYTQTEKDKLAGIAEGAQVNVIESVVVNGVTATVENKVATVAVDCYTKAEVDAFWAWEEL